MLNEKILVWKAQHGCTDSMRRIYEKYKDDLLTLANALLNDLAAAEDVVHDVFTAFAQNIADFRLRKSLKGYFVTCVRNLARDRIRSSQRHAQKHSELRPDQTDYNSPAGAAIERETAQQLRTALEELPWDQREVVLLRVREDLTFKKIATLQQVSINTVQGRYRYGIDKLRSILKDEVYL